MTDRVVAVLALATAALAVWLAAIGPDAAGPLPSGFVTPILALELATSEADLQAVLGDPADPATAARVAAFLRTHTWDFAFMVAYAGLVAGSAWQVGGRTARWGVPAAVVVWGADVVETLVLADLTAGWGVFEVPPGHLVVLVWATWTKWLVLAAAIGIVGWGWGGRWRWAGAVPGIFGAIAWLWPPWWAEAMALAIVGAFGVLIVGALRRAISGRTGRDPPRAPTGSRS